jgi:hypothetical protein
MLKKIVIAVFVGGLLSPVGLAFSHTGGKGIAPRGYSPCSKKARAAGGYHPMCVTTVHKTVTKYKTTTRRSLTTKTVNHTTTSTKRTTYTSTHTGGNVTHWVTVTSVGTDTFTTTVYPDTVTKTETVPETTTTILKPVTLVTSTDTTTTVTDVVTEEVPFGGGCALARLTC